MRRTPLTLCVLLLLAGLAWVAAPALSLSRYVPEPVEFEQALPEPPPEARAAGADSRFAYRTAVIEAPRRFDAVGVAGELRPVEFRVRGDGDAWSAWIESADGTPVWAGGADELQLRSHDFAPRGRLHYVNVSGTATAADRALTALRGSVNTAFVSIASLTPAQAEVERPTIRSRHRWDPGADCRPRTEPVRGEVKAAAIHHTVNANDYSRGEVADMILAICLYHRNGNGWNDIGYNALVDRFGRVWTGRAGGLARAVVGAHAQGVNSQTTGLASLGDHRGEKMSKPAMSGAADYLAWKLTRHGIENAKGRTVLVSDGGEVSRYDRGARVKVKRIFGHRRVNLTSCPGQGLFRQLKGLRNRTQKRIDAAEAPVEPVDPIEPPPDGGVPSR